MSNIKQATWPAFTSISSSEKKKKEGDSTHLSCPMRFEFQESDLRGKGRRKEEMTDRQTLVKQSWGRVGHEHCDGEAGARQQPRTSVCLLCTA